MKESLERGEESGETGETQVLMADGDGDTLDVVNELSDESDETDESPKITTEKSVSDTTPDFKVKVHDDSAEQSNVSNGASKPSPRDTTPDNNMSDAKENNTPAHRVGKIGRRHRKGRLLMRPVLVDESKTESSVIPRDHYQTVLYRRAIRKPPTSFQQSTDEAQLDENGDEIFGDTSLGMKLNVLGGKVIVQSLNPLGDGRASPAQLSGLIQRGDVLIQIDDVSLVNLPINQLMKGLGPLSTPDEKTGAYRRKLTLRLASGRGLELLRQAEGVHADDKGMTAHVPGSQAVVAALDPAAEMFSMFPMVDQLSGMPIIASEVPHPATLDGAASRETGPESLKLLKHDHDELEEQSSSQAVSSQAAPTSLDELIGQNLAEERIMERKKVISEFFSRPQGISLTLHYEIETHVDETPLQSSGTNDLFSGLTPSEMIDIGTKALKGAKALSAIMERLDTGSDRRSFQSLSATLSLYSRASTRRRYVLDGRAMPVHFDKVQEAALSEEEEEEGDADDNSAANSDEEEQLDGDELLVQLAATDEIWRKQVIDFLEQVIKHSLEEASDESTQQDSNIDMSNELGSFLFGAKMTEVLKRQKKSHALPPAEITSLLFDLTTKISASIPDRIKAEGGPITVRSSVVPFIGMKKPSSDSNIMLANHFLLDQVLPLWLKSFRPLPLDQRRILWPPERLHALESTAGSTMSGDDSLTVDSFTTKNTAVGSQRKSRKNLREQIEDNELDPESRAETCFLTTYFFTQHLLPRLLHRGGGSSQTENENLEQLSEFVAQFGAYLKLHTCFAYAAVLEASELIDSLLDVAKYDPRHREVMKQTARPSALIIYDSTMLSAVMQRLKEIRSSTPERRRATINLCYQAYPDLRPWQVKEACYGKGQDDQSDQAKDLTGLYYKYLCLLLHPSDGHEGARHHPALVREFCTLSVKRMASDPGKSKNRSNFFQVASKTSSDHLAYTRDLPLLLKLSMEAKEFDLSLDLAAEILDTNTNLNSKKSLRILIGFVTDIGKSSVDSFLEEKSKGIRVLKRVLRLYNRISMLATDAAKAVVSIPVELITLLEHVDLAPIQPEGGGVNDLVTFFATEARPIDILEALAQWSTASNCDRRLYPTYQIALKHGVRENGLAEMSGSLYRVIQAHSKFEESIRTLTSFPELVPPPPPVEVTSLWVQLSYGTLALEK